MIRPATPSDVASIHGLLCELADFEKLRHEVRSTPGDLHAALFGDSPILEALVVNHPDGDDSGLIAFALFYPTFSSFTGKRGLWLEDVYVQPEFRSKGLGRRILEHFLSLARERGCARAEWSVLDWNERAIAFYERHGATVMPDWRIARVSDP